MDSFQNSGIEIQIQDELLIAHITQVYNGILNLDSLKPSKKVNNLFSHLVNLCILPSSLNINSLSLEEKEMRKNLITLSGRAEGLLELEYASFMIKMLHPLNNLNLFPYYGNYVKLAKMEYEILAQNRILKPKKVAFVGSGPMPLTSLVMATHHLKSCHFDNYDIDEAANNVARQMVSTDDDLERRMKFVTCDIVEVKEKLREYDCIFLAALVGMSKEEKLKIIEHIRKYMKEGGILLVRSADGARAFLYPIVDEKDLTGFEILSIFHPKNDVINSVVLVRKPVF